MRRYAEQFNSDLLGAQAGIFFAIINMYFACGGDLQSKEKPFDYFVLIFGIVTLLNAGFIPFFKMKFDNLAERRPLITEQLNADELSLVQSFDRPATQSRWQVYEKIIFALSAAGTTNAAFNIARFNPAFSHLVFNSVTSKVVYATFIFSLSAAPLILNATCSNVFQKSLMEACGKSGVWIGAIFALFLTQFVMFSQASIPPLEVNSMASVMGALFLIDLAMSLKFNLSPTERGGYFFIFLEMLRTAVTAFGNMMAVPNILSLSNTFNVVTDGHAKQLVYGVVGMASLLFGFHKARQVTDKHCQALNREDSGLEGFSEPQGV